ncbi:MAG: 16S rRNA (guanine(966)-N(2))-methyltransferase RsmD [Myxococcota bacterium]
MRPTTDRVREALFSLVVARTDLEGAAVLDLFAGTGALGCEALSRGAERVVFVDVRRASLAIVRENLTRIAHEGQTLVCGDVQRMLKRLDGPFDVVFLDPPYADHRVEPTLKALWSRRTELLAPQALICAEHGPDEPLTTLEGYTHITTRGYGDVRVSLWTLAEP